MKKMISINRFCLGVDLVFSDRHETKFRSLSTIILVTLILTLLGCSSNQEKLGEWAVSHQAKTQVITTSEFQLQAIMPPELPANKSLRIFIEGDGRAWATRSQPSLDPTPSSMQMANLAISSSSVYLARPCQFVMSAGCNQNVWTDERFGREIVDTFHQAIDKLKSSTSASSIELVGYSGGATIALILASERSDIASIQSIAGNLDPNAWVTLNKLSPLHGSIDPLIGADKLSVIPQRHFVSVNDSVIPHSITRKFVKKISAKCADLIYAEGDHSTILYGISSDQIMRKFNCN